MYQPQVSQWQGNQISFRSALAFMPKGGKQETFGVMVATARTQVDRINRSVVFENLQITSSNCSPPCPTKAPPSRPICRPPWPARCAPSRWTG
jgi:hypothetical protein